MMSAIKTFKVNISKPLKLIRSFWSKETLRRIADQLYNPLDSDELKSFSIAFGVFIGITPIWGFQTLAALFLATIFKLNKSLVGIGALISIPPMMPLIIFLSYKIGGYWTGHSASQSFNLRLWQYICGSVTLAVIASLACGLLTFLILKVVKLVKQYRLTTSWTKLNNRLLFPSISITLK